MAKVFDFPSCFPASEIKDLSSCDVIIPWMPGLGGQGL